MADTDTDTVARARGKFSDEGLYSIGTRYAPLGNWKPLLENETSLPTSWSAAIIHVRLFFHCVRVWLQIFWRATLLKMSFSHSLFFFIIIILSFVFFPFLFSFFFFFNLFCFRQFLWFSSLFSFSFPFFPFLLFFFSFYLSIYPSIHPPDNGQFSVPQKRRIRERSNNIYSPPSFEETYEIFPSAASSACLLSLRNDTLSPFFFNIFLFFSSSIVPRDRESLLKFRIACKYFQISNSFKKKKEEKDHERSWSRKDREVLFVYLFFFFVSLFFDKFSKFSSKSAKIVARTRANVNEDRRDPRDTLPFSQQPHVYHPRLSLGLLLLLSMRIFNIFPLFIYFFLSRVSCYFRFFFFFPH